MTVSEPSSVFGYGLNLEGHGVGRSMEWLGLSFRGVFLCLASEDVRSSSTLLAMQRGLCTAPPSHERASALPQAS